MLMHRHHHRNYRVSVGLLQHFSRISVGFLQDFCRIPIGFL